MQPNEEEKRFLEQGKLISAIKSLRDRTGMHLKDCLITVRAWNGSCPHGWKLVDGVAQGCWECK
jgi:hypothetical protein